MLHDVPKNYLAEVEQAILRCGNAYTERYVEEILTPVRANLRIRLRTSGGHYMLEIQEAAVVVDDRLVHLDYRYHCQDSQNRLRFHYDSTPHFPDLPGFPHHKHLADERVIASERPDIEQLNSGGYAMTLKNHELPHRRHISMNNVEELARALDYPWENLSRFRKYFRNVHITGTVRRGRRCRGTARYDFRIQRPSPALLTLDTPEDEIEAVAEWLSLRA